MVIISVWQSDGWFCLFFNTFVISNFFLPWAGNTFIIWQQTIKMEKRGTTNDAGMPIAVTIKAESQFPALISFPMDFPLVADLVPLFRNSNYPGQISWLSAHGAEEYHWFPGKIIVWDFSQILLTLWSPHSLSPWLSSLTLQRPPSHMHKLKFQDVQKPQMLIITFSFFFF